jgi:hypothetical protein
MDRKRGPLLANRVSAAPRRYYVTTPWLAGKFLSIVQEECIASKIHEDYYDIIISRGLNYSY